MNDEAKKNAKASPAASSTVHDETHARVHERLQERVSNALRVPEGGFTLRADDGEWLRFSEQIDFKILCKDDGAGTQTALWRLQPGAVFPQHPHTHDEECLVLKGRLKFGEHQLEPGDFHFMKSGFTHPVAKSENGCLLLIRAQEIRPPGKIASAVIAAQTIIERMKD